MVIDYKAELRHIINVLGPYPVKAHTGHEMCEGCLYEINEALITAINAYTEIPWSITEEFTVMKRNDGKKGLPMKSGDFWEVDREPTRTVEERYEWWQTHGMSRDPREEHKDKWHLTEHAEWIKKREEETKKNA